MSTGTQQTHEALQDPPCSAGGCRERTGGGVEVRTDQFGIKVAAAADRKPCS